MDAVWAVVVVVALLGLAIALGATDVDTTVHYVRIILVHVAAWERELLDRLEAR